MRHRFDSKLGQRRARLLKMKICGIWDAKLRQSGEHYFCGPEAILEQAIADYLSHVPIFVRELNGSITYWSKGAEELYGYTWDEAVGAISHALLATVFPAPLRDIEEHLRMHGDWQGLLQHTRRDGSEIWVQAHWRLKATSANSLIVETCTDVTQRELLSRELAHRVKNVLAIVQGLARFSFSGADALMKDRFDERLKALSQANDLLVLHQWEGADLCELLRTITRRFDIEDRCTLNGPEVRLRPSAVIAYSLAFHELVTNAIKYGSLSQPGGGVEVVWRLADGAPPAVALVWTERGGPPVTPPKKSGFGLRLIDRAVATELGSPVRFNFKPGGLVCEFGGAL